MVCATLANINRDAKKHPKPYQPSDFMPVRQTAPKKPQTWQQMKSIAKAWTRIMGGKIVRKADAGNPDS